MQYLLVGEGFICISWMLMYYRKTDMNIFRSLRFSESSGLRLRTSYGSGTSVSAEEARTSFGAYVGSARSEEPLSTLRTSETPIEYRAVSSGTGPTDSFWQNADPATYSVSFIRYFSRRLRFLNDDLPSISHKIGQCSPVFAPVA